MSNSNPTTAVAAAARTHAEAGELLRRPFAPGAIGFRAMTKVTLNGVQYGGAQVAAFLGAQSVVQRLNHVVPGRWQQQFTPVPAELTPSADNGRGPSRLYLACRLTITLPVEVGGPDVDAVYVDVGEMDAGSFAGLKALYSDARKRAGVAAGIGAYLYTALAPVVLAIGPGDRQVQAIRRGQGKSDLLAISPATEQWLRHGYEARMNTDAVRRDLGAILAHGEPETGMGQGEAAEDKPATRRHASPRPAAAAPVVPGCRGQRRGGRGLRRPRTRRRMSGDVRSRLAAQAAAAGYPPDLLAQIADATLPAYQPGQQLDDPQIEQVTDAVEVLAQAGYRAGTLADHIAEYQRRHRSDWRERFWARALRIATVRYRHPDIYGLSPVRDRPGPARPTRRPPTRACVRGAGRLNPPALSNPRRPRSRISPQPPPAPRRRRRARRRRPSWPPASRCRASSAFRGLGPRARYLPHEPTSTGAAMPNSFADRYRAAMRETGGCCPIEAGLLGRLADHECAHGRLPGDRTAKCGCWPQENAPIIASPVGHDRRKPHGRPPDRRWAARAVHRCPVGDCTARVPREQLMCPPHWQLVPPKLKRALRASVAGRPGRRHPRAPRRRPCVHRRRALGLPARLRSEPPSGRSAGSSPATGTPTTSTARAGTRKTCPGSSA